MNKMPIIGLDTLSQEIQAQMMLVGDEAVKRLAQKVVDEAKAHAPEGLYDDVYSKGKHNQQTGKLKDKLFVKKSEKYDYSYLAVSGHWTSHFLEFGTQPHDMPTKNKGPMIFKWKKGATRGMLVEAGKVHHPGISAQPFMRPAGDKAESMVDEVVSEMDI